MSAPLAGSEAAPQRPETRAKIQAKTAIAQESPGDTKAKMEWRREGQKQAQNAKVKKVDQTRRSRDNIKREGQRLILKREGHNKIQTRRS